MVAVLRSEPELEPDLIYNLWKEDEFIGTCALDTAGDLVVIAKDPNEQAHLFREVWGKFKRLSLYKGKSFTLEEFLGGFTRYMASRDISVYWDTSRLGAKLDLATALPPFDLSMIPEDF